MPSALCVYLLLACLVILIMQTRARTVNRSLRDQPTAVNRPAASQKANVMSLQHCLPRDIYISRCSCSCHFREYAYRRGNLRSYRFVIIVN